LVLFCPDNIGMNLVIDQGNTKTKLGLYAEDHLQLETEFESHEIEQIENWISNEGSETTHVLISSVIDQTIKMDGKEVLQFDENTDLPIFNKYKTKDTLGKDRLANAVAIWMKNPNQNSLCIDLGTCIKYDLVNADGAYLGGNISPGLKMRFSALNHYTSKLPLLEPAHDLGLYGKSTDSSIHEGVQQGIYHEINGFIERYSIEMEGLTIFMTGGDLKFFDKEYKNPIFADAGLTLFGLNEILKHNT